MYCKAFAAFVLLVLPFRAPALSAGDFQWEFVNALTGGEIEKIDRILSEHISEMSVHEKRTLYGFVLTYSRNENTLRALELLLKHGVHAAPYDLYKAVDNSHIDRVVDVILNDGVKPNGEILLLASERQRWDLVRRFVEMGADINYRYPAGKSYADGMTALIHAAKHKNLEIVKLLVEHGAGINLRTNTGVTAAALAYENGAVEIYDYLKEQGAADFAPVPPRGNGAGGQGISALMENGAFRSGTYRLSGSAAEIRFTGNGGSGYLSYKGGGEKEGAGTFIAAGNTMTITVEGLTFTYRIDTSNSFSGNGETWLRVGD
jgi:hypothetical protein